MQDLKKRTKSFSIDVLKFCDLLEKNSISQIIQKQLMRSCTSVAANYRAACRAQSRAAFIAKLAIVEEETDKSLFWLELIEELDLNHTTQATPGRSQPTNSYHRSIPKNSQKEPLIS